MEIINCSPRDRATVASLLWMTEKESYIVKTVLTGIKPTGVPHVGNYFGAIKPAVGAAGTSGDASFLFIADYHALTTVKNAKELKQHVREIACTWLACGLDVNKTAFYCQSSVSEIFELATILSNYTPKGLLNRAHAYKDIVQNKGKGDEEVNMGLFNYPVLMAADILAFGTTHVPVGKDQKQHVEIAQSIARAFNAVHGDILTVPAVQIKDDVAVVPGLDGRKMSKSYGNQIPLFCSSKELESYVKKVVTDSSLPTEPKSIDMDIFKIYKLFATKEELKVMEQKFKTGVGWGDVKKELFRVAEREIAPLREKYEYYMANYNEVEKVLLDGAEKAGGRAKKVLDKVRCAVGVI